MMRGVAFEGKRHAHEQIWRVAARVACAETSSARRQQAVRKENSVYAALIRQPPRDEDGCARIQITEHICSMLCRDVTIRQDA